MYPVTCTRRCSFSNDVSRYFIKIDKPESIIIDEENKNDPTAVPAPVTVCKPAAIPKTEWIKLAQKHFYAASRILIY